MLTLMAESQEEMLGENIGTNDWMAVENLRECMVVKYFLSKLWGKVVCSKL